MKTEKIILASDRNGVIAHTWETEVRVIYSEFIPEKKIYWDRYLGQDKDQSPTGWGVVVYEPRPNFPGLFKREEALDDWDGPMDVETIDAIMTLIEANIINAYPKNNLPDLIGHQEIGGFVRAILRAIKENSREFLRKNEEQGGVKSE